MGWAADTLHFAFRKGARELGGLIALLRYSFRKRQVRELLESSMSSINLETTNICNADCVFCAYGQQERPTGVMSLELFHKVVDEYAALGGGHVGLTPTVGDPLVDPHIVERIRYLRSKPEIQSVGMFSNMISLQRAGVEALVRSGLTRLTVSMSGFDDAMYRRVYRSKMYPKVIANVKAFARANNAAERPVHFALDLRVDRPLREIYASPDYPEVAQLVGAENINIKLRYDSWGGKISSDALSGNMRLRKHSWLRHPHLTACTEMYNGPAIYWNGTVGACNCRDVDAQELVIGDINRQSLREIWFGEELRKLRREFTTPQMRDICKSCTHYNNLSLYLYGNGAKALAEIRPCRIPQAES